MVWALYCSSGRERRPALLLFLCYFLSNDINHHKLYCNLCSVCIYHYFFILIIIIIFYAHPSFSLSHYLFISFFFSFFSLLYIIFSSSYPGVSYLRLVLRAELPLAFVNRNEMQTKDNGHVFARSRRK